jgi:hypothetical protein
MHKVVIGFIITVFIVIAVAGIATVVNRVTLKDTYMGVGVVIDKIHTPATSHTTYNSMSGNNSAMPRHTTTPAKYEVFVEIAGKCIAANAETAVEWAQYSKGQEVHVTERVGCLGHYDYTMVPK